MIEVKHLTKAYGNHKAVSDLSFTVEDGRIYGFLGPNGAGKSTTMNMITGCLAATEGTVTIDGFDIFEDYVEAKKRIGYLPEIPPVFTDMTPKEYLNFVADAKKVSKNERNNHISEIMAKTGITDVCDRLIKNLSKGYRQRVGIAQALIGDPSIIILDEPTVGLDPKQIMDIRDLIKQLGEKHTVILSSHILSEVQAVCDEILIISKGRLVACDTPENLETLFAGTNSLEIAAKCTETDARKVLSGVSGAESVKYGKSGGFTDVVITAEKNTNITESVFFAFANAGIPLYKIAEKSASLEDIFIELTSDDEALPSDEPAAADTENAAQNDDTVISASDNDVRNDTVISSADNNEEEGDKQ